MSLADGDLAWGAADWMRILTYGESGVGKTTFASTFPERILWLVCSGGSRPGELKSIDTPQNRRRIEPRIIRSTGMVGQLVKRAMSGEFSTVVLDHASGFQDLCIKEMLGLPAEPVAKYKRAGKKESWSLVSQQQYGQLAIQCKEFFRDLLNLPCHVVIIAQQRVFGKDEEDSEIINPTVGAAMTPSVVGWLNPAVDYIAQCFKRPKMERYTTTVAKGTAAQKEVPMVRRVPGVEYCLRTGPHNVFHSKFRVPMGKVLPEEIVNPTFDKLMAVLQGRWKGG